MTEFVQDALLIMNVVGPGFRLIGASWSLPVEVQMYVVLPFLFFFMRSSRELLPLLLLDGLAVITARAVSPSIAQNLLFCAPLFIPGAIAYQIYRRGPSDVFPPWCFPVWLATLVLSVNWYASREQASFRSGWFFALLLGSSLPFFRQLSSPFVNRISHLIARYSYGLYLCHFAAIAVAIHYMAGFPLLPRILAFLVVLVGLSVGFYHTVEQPMIRLGSRVASGIGRGKEVRMDERELNLEVVP